jgi:hypothetical protein
VRAVTTRTDAPVTTGRRLRDLGAVLLLLLGIGVMLGASALIDLRLTALICGVLAFTSGAALAVDRSDT